jgi:integrase/recombinase XerD
MENESGHIFEEAQGHYEFKVVLSHLEHKGMKQIKIDFPYNELLKKELRKIKGVAWSSTKRCWYILNKPENLSLIFSAFRGIAWVDAKALFGEKTDWLEDISRRKKGTRMRKMKLEHPVHVENIEKIEKFLSWLRNKRYSQNTIRTYMECVKTFFHYFHDKLAEEIKHEDIILFNNEYILENGYSATFQNQILSALKLFYRVIENRHIDLDKLERPKKENKLPNVLSKKEIGLILSAHNNMKHRAVLSLIYSCGLRRSEALNLQLRDVDSERRLLIIRKAKGRRDRIVPLSEKTLFMLRNYYKMYKPYTWLFEGQNRGDQYSETSLELILKRAVRKAGIDKPVTLHWLRHSYATHLLEGGTDLRYIQELLGHKSSRTTEIYTHVSTKSLQNIKSPFDDLDL